MDLASILPEWVSARRGSLFLGLIAIVTCPWNLVNAPGTFITVIGSLGIFVSPLIGIFCADYIVVRRRKYKVPDLYVGNKSSIYWYQYGFHWRGFLTWLMLIWVSIRKSFNSYSRYFNSLWWTLPLTKTLLAAGFAVALSGYQLNPAWLQIFRISFLIGKYIL
jgi:cytosine/uracil/thiamine/allantoin permease